MEYKIPLRNKDKEIIDYCLVSQEDFEHLNQFKWSKIPSGYVLTGFNKKTWSIHRYIMIEILKNDITSKVKIDHINNNPLDNRRENLRVASDSLNARNKLKSKNATSNFYGVSFNIKQNVWFASLSHNNKTLIAIYNNEYFAAHQYNLWCKEYNYDVNLNIIQEYLLEEFILYTPRDKVENLPKNISLTYNNKFLVRIKNQSYGIYDTLEKAINIKTIKLKELKENSKKILLEKPILRNENGEAIIELFNKKKEKTGETIVDDDIYYDLIKYKWYISNTYVLASINNTSIRLHRYVKKYNGIDDIDHINNNKLDNRIENLRIVTREQNNKNRQSAKNSSSKFVGVSFNKETNKWISYITVNKSKKFLGYFNDEIEAAKVRDEATKKYYGEYGYLNQIAVQTDE